MKKIILTVVTIFTFLITTAQEKANHNTTRSNETQGIMVKEPGDSVDQDCDAVVNNNLRELKDAEIINKSSLITKKNNKYFIYKGKQEDLDKHNNTIHQNKIGENNTGGCDDSAYMECSWICGSCMCRLKQDCLVIMNPDFGDHNNEVLPLIEINNNVVVNKTDLIIKKNKKRYKVIADKKLIQKIRTNKKYAKWIEILSFNNAGNNATKRKRSKNFNRKGERIKRTKF
jgi:hypothetical protein